jgi:hypothetical protein
MAKKIKFFGVTHSPTGGIFGTVYGKSFGLEEARVVAPNMKKAIELVKEQFNDQFVSAREITDKKEIGLLMKKIKKVV